MYQTRAFWGKESNENINTINNTLNTVSAPNLIFIVIVIVGVLTGAMFLTTCRGFS